MDPWAVAAVFLFVLCTLLFVIVVRLDSDRQRLLRKVSDLVRERNGDDG